MARTAWLAALGFLTVIAGAEARAQELPRSSAGSAGLQAEYRLTRLGAVVRITRVDEAAGRGYDDLKVPVQVFDLRHVRENLIRLELRPNAFAVRRHSDASARVSLVGALVEPETGRAAAVVREDREVDVELARVVATDAESLLRALESVPSGSSISLTRNALLRLRDLAAVDLAEGRRAHADALFQILSRAFENPTSRAETLALADSVIGENSRRREGRADAGFENAVEGWRASLLARGAKACPLFFEVPRL